MASSGPTGLSPVATDQRLPMSSFSIWECSCTYDGIALAHRHSHFLPRARKKAAGSELKLWESLRVLSTWVLCAGLPSAFLSPLPLSSPPLRYYLSITLRQARRKSPHTFSMCYYGRRKCRKPLSYAIPHAYFIIILIRMTLPMTLKRQEEQP